MRHICMLFVLILFISCSSQYLVKYDVSGESELFEVTYLINGVNIKETCTEYWNIDFIILSSEDIGIYVKSLDGKEIDVRVFFIGYGDWILYDRKVSNDFVLIKGRINSIL